MAKIVKPSETKVSIPFDLLKIFEAQKSVGFIIDDYSPIGFTLIPISILNKLVAEKELLAKVNEQFDILLVPKSWRTQGRE